MASQGCPVLSGQEWGSAVSRGPLARGEGVEVTGNRIRLCDAPREEPDRPGAGSQDGIIPLDRSGWRRRYFRRCRLNADKRGICAACLERPGVRLGTRGKGPRVRVVGRRSHLDVRKRVAMKGVGPAAPPGRICMKRGSVTCASRSRTLFQHLDTEMQIDLGFPSSGKA